MKIVAARLVRFERKFVDSIPARKSGNRHRPNYHRDYMRLHAEKYNARRRAAYRNRKGIK